MVKLLCNDVKSHHLVYLNSSVFIGGQPMEQIGDL